MARCSCGYPLPSCVSSEKCPECLIEANETGFNKHDVPFVVFDEYSSLEDFLAKAENNYFFNEDTGEYLFKQAK